jgi:hypothetical protein
MFPGTEGNFHYIAELDFLECGESVVFVGKPEVGKSGLASALRLKALYAGRAARAITAQTYSRSSSTAKPTAPPRDSSTVRIIAFLYNRKRHGTSLDPIKNWALRKIIH